MEWGGIMKSLLLDILSMRNLILTLSLLSASCGRVRIEPKTVQDVVENLSSQSLFCTIAPKEIGKFTNILFVMDQSGSNATTDPSKLRRTKAIKTFLGAHRSNSYLKWGFISFNGSFGAKSFIQKSNGGYFGSAVDMDAALTQFSATPDNGGTPFESALTMTKAAIEKEIDLGSASTMSSFSVVFISDGRPDPEIVPASRLFDMVSSLVSLGQGGVYLSTVYYNNKEPVASDRQRLSDMATLGKGIFQDATLGDASINIEDLIIGGVYLEPYVLSDLFIYNLNSTTCDNGMIGVDSDADGLCDIDEFNYSNYYGSQIDQDAKFRGKRFSITQRNSFLENYSDYFFLRKLRGELLPDCTTPERDSYVDMLNACEKKLISSPNPIGPTPTWTDEIYSHGKSAFVDYYDTDGDNMLDGLELFFFKDKGAPLNFYNQFTRTNGLEHLELFRNHQHPLRPETSKPYKPKLTFVRRNDRGDLCYQFEQESLSLYKTKAVGLAQSSQNSDLLHVDNENVILVYYVLKTENSPNGKGILKYSYQKKTLGNGSEQVDLSKGVFETFSPSE